VLRDSVRLLHRRNDNGDKSTARKQSFANPRRSLGRTQWERVPMHWLSSDRGRRLGCRQKRAITRASGSNKRPASRSLRRGWVDDVFEPKWRARRSVAAAARGVRLRSGELLLP